VLAVAVPCMAAAQFRTVETVEIGGAYDLIAIPADWNGSLFIYAHGYTADERFLAPLPDDLTLGNFTEKLPLLLQASVLPALSGYAIATTTFSSVGWYVEDAVRDVERLRRYFVRRYGRPKFTYVWGHSGGGLVTATVIEKFPNAYDGAMPMCGPVAGARRNFNGAFDLRVLYEYVCGDVPGAEFTCGLCSDGRTRCLDDSQCPAGQTCDGREPPAPPELGLGAECTEFLLRHPETFSESPTSPGGGFVEGPVGACLGDVTGAVSPTAAQQARRDFFLRASGIPESFIGTDLFFASIGMAEVVHRRTGGRPPWGNIGVDYARPSLSPAEAEAVNEGVYRSASFPRATVYMQRWYEPRARTGSKVLTIHALDDGLVIPENETVYRDAFARAHRSDQLVQLFTEHGGHCGFVTELFPALAALTGWVERSEKPSTASVMAACPTCDFTTDVPGAFEDRVAARRQRGVPRGRFGEPGPPLVPPGAARGRFE
jgi:hypothetical protein